MSVKEIHVGKLIRSDQVQVRKNTDRMTVDKYAKHLLGKGDLDPVVAFRDPDTGDLYLSSGFHRVEAAIVAGKINGKATVSVEVREGTLRDAAIFACEANKHGLPLDNHGKRTAVTRLLLDPECSTLTDREIARRVGVTHPYVAKLKRELTGNTDAAPAPEDRSDVNQDETDVVTVTTPADGNGCDAASEFTAFAICPSPATVTVSVANRCPGDDDDRDFVDVPTDPEDEPESDEVFLARMPLIDKLDGIQKMRYTADCLLWRRMEGERKRYVSRLRAEYKLLAKGLRGVESPYFSKQVYRVGRAPGAPQFKLCRDCSGSGTRPFLGSTSCCPTCDSHGYRVD